MTLSVGQFQLSGLVFGDRTDYGVNSATGLRGLPPININDQPRQRQDGSFPSWSYMAERTVTFLLDIVPSGTNTLESDMAALASAFGPTDNPAALNVLSFLLDSSWTQPRGLTCRVSKFEPLYDVGSSVGAYYSPFDIQLIAPDPVVYDATQTTTTATGTGPFTATMTNHGNRSMYPIITVSAIGSGTIAVNGTNVITWTTNMGTTSPWVFNCQNHTITDTNGNSQYAALSGPPAWSQAVLTPGANTFVVSASGYGGGAGMTVQWASAWAGL